MSIAKLAAGGEGYYLDTVARGAEEYYTGAREAPGVWLGMGAVNLGLSGEVEADQLSTVLSGSNTTGGERLVPANRKVPGFDLTFSAPKSVSLLHALAGREASQAAVDAHDAAVRAVLGWLEREACFIRRGHNGVDVQRAGGFVAAGFRHRTSRAGDPQLHTHVLVANIAQAADGRWGALDARHLYRLGRTAGFLYQAELRAGLTRALGVEWGPVRHGQADLAAIPRHVLRVFSRRRRQIDAYLADVGRTGLIAGNIAALKTRAPKDAVTADRAEWQQRAAVAGLTDSAWWQVLSLRPQAPETVVVADVDRRRLTEALLASDAAFDRPAVLRALAEQAADGATVPVLEARADSVLAAPEIVTLADGAATTTSHLRIERDLLANAVAGLNADTAVARADVIDGAIAEAGSLTAEQQDAVRRLTGGGHRIDVLIGRPGSGKTHAVRAAAEAWAASGYTVVGAAVAARTARQLETTAGIPSMTLTRLLTHGLTRPLDARTVVVVDEAGMIGTRQLADLAANTTRAGAKLVLVGDDQQLPEIPAGGAFRAIAVAVDAVALTDNRRQRDVAERDTLLHIRRGRHRPAVKNLTATGRVTTATTRSDLLDRMIDDWAGARADGKTVLLLAHRRDDISELNTLARDRRRSDGHLGARVPAPRHELYVGDEIMLLRNDRRLGVLNGQRATVNGNAGPVLDVALDDGRRIELPAAYVATAVQLGYASTIHKAQGATVDVALVLSTDGLHRQATYTALSRGRDRNQLYATAEHADQLEDDLTRRLQRDGTKRLALDHGVVREP